VRALRLFFCLFDVDISVALGLISSLSIAELMPSSTWKETPLSLPSSAPLSPSPFCLVGCRVTGGVSFGEVDDDEADADADRDVETPSSMAMLFERRDDDDLSLLSFEAAPLPLLVLFDLLCDRMRAGSCGFDFDDRRSNEPCAGAVEPPSLWPRSEDATDDAVETPSSIARRVRVACDDDGRDDMDEADDTVSLSVLSATETETSRDPPSNDSDCEPFVGGIAPLRLWLVFGLFCLRCVFCLCRS
jgi:hypothetical protein